jgi:L-fuculose-phosphate aldolase
VLPHIKATNTIILANHGTVTFGPSLENAYFNTEIIDAYCKILILARQLGKVNYFTNQETKELLDLKKRLGYDDPRFQTENCDLCSNNTFGRGYVEGVSAPKATPAPAAAAAALPPGVDFEKLVQAVTDQVMKSLAKAS